MNYKPVIGLEVHVELKTKSKMFCGCSADNFGKEPNTHVCPVCLGLPGALPVPNKKAIEWCVMIGLALNCKIPLFSKFDRKNYFYPDLPKGYQISQYDQPFCVDGFVILNSFQDLKPKGNEMPKQVRHDTEKRVRIRRVHMEEDTAKLVHQFGAQSAKRKAQNNGVYSLIDFNRSGVPLVEIVTEPDFESATEVVEYLKKLQQIVRYLEVSDADMEKGEMRLEPNISLGPSRHSGGSEKTDRIPSEKDSIPYRPSGSRVQNDKLPNYKVEVKNINSFRFVEKAVNYEIERQKKLLQEGKTPVQETRGWDEKKQITVTQRVKEEAMDYRYFPEPDIPPVRWRKFQISNFKSQIPELPDKRSLRFQKEYGLSVYNSEILVKEKSTADYFEETVKVNHELILRPASQRGEQAQDKKVPRSGIPPRGKKCTDIKTIANWIVNKKVDINIVLPAHLIQNILTSGQTTAIDTDKLERIVRKVLEKNPKAVEDYKKGKTQVIGFLIGQAKQTFKQPLDTQHLKQTIEKLLEIN